MPDEQHKHKHHHKKKKRWWKWVLIALGLFLLVDAVIVGKLYFDAKKLSMLHIKLSNMTISAPAVSI